MEPDYDRELEILTLRRNGKSIEEISSLVSMPIEKIKKIIISSAKKMATEGYNNKEITNTLGVDVKDKEMTPMKR